MVKGKIRNGLLKGSFVVSMTTMLISALATETYLWKAIAVFAIATAYSGLFIFVNQSRWDGVL